MKKLNLVKASVLFVVAALGLVSCEPDKVDLTKYPSDSLIGNPSLTVDFGGIPFESDSASVAIANGVTTITGLKGTKGEQFTIVVQGDKVRKDDAGELLPYTDSEVSITYTTGGNNAREYTNVNPEPGDTDPRTISGSVTFETIDAAANIVAARFSFTGWNSNNAANKIVFFNGKVQIGAALITPDPVDPEVPGVPTGNQYFRAKVDGVEKDFTLILPAAVLQNTLTLSASEANASSMIALMLAADIAPGTYDMVDSPLDGPHGTYTIMSSTPLGFTTTTGSITIISNDATAIKGTFHYTATDFEETTTIEITDGEFYIEY